MLIKDFLDTTQKDMIQNLTHWTLSKFKNFSVKDTIKRMKRQQIERKHL